MKGTDSKWFTLLFESDDMSPEDLKGQLKGLRVQKLRWLASFHPDSRVRTEALRASGVEVGEKVFISIGLVVLDDYRGIVSIGDRVAFGNYVSLIAASAPNDSILSQNPEVKSKLIKFEPIKIGADAWIGAGSIILPGVTIGERAIIGAGAVISKDVPCAAIVAGIPGRVIRTIEGELE